MYLRWRIIEQRDKKTIFEMHGLQCSARKLQNIPLELTKWKIFSPRPGIISGKEMKQKTQKFKIMFTMLSFG